jgi:hypothetical protein
MCTTCKCDKPTLGVDTSPSIQTMNLADLSALATRNATRLSARSIRVEAADVAVLSAVHTTSDGGVFLSTSSIGPLQGDISLAGTIGPFPVELHLAVKLDGDSITVTLEVDKPIHLGPFTWTFKLGGVTRDARGNIVSAQTITLSPDTPAFEAAGFGSHFLCILKCAGLAILPILIECLPSLAGGPQGFIACVVARAGTGAAAIAACFAKCVTA